MLNERQSHSHVRRKAPRLPTMTITPTTLLNLLPAGGRGIVARVVSASPEVDAVALRRLGELGFIPGEPVQLLHRGPGGREPLAVLVGETMFALRLLEAQCVEVSLVEQPLATAALRNERRAVPKPARASEARPADPADQGSQ